MEENKNVKNYDEMLKEALKEYFLRKDRESHPDGRFDNANRWYPSEKEKCDCCNGIRKPSSKYPYSLIVHCRSITHIANIYAVSESDLRKKAREYLREERAVSENKNANNELICNRSRTLKLEKDFIVSFWCTFKIEDTQIELRLR